MQASVIPQFESLSYLGRYDLNLYLHQVLGQQPGAGRGAGWASPQRLGNREALQGVRQRLKLFCFGAGH